MRLPNVEGGAGFPLFLWQNKKGERQHQSGKVAVTSLNLVEVAAGSSRIEALVASGLCHFFIAAVEMGMVTALAAAFLGHIDFHAALIAVITLSLFGHRGLRRRGIWIALRHFGSNLVGHGNLLLEEVTWALLRPNKLHAIGIPTCVKRNCRSLQGITMACSKIEPSTHLPTVR